MKRSTDRILTTHVGSLPRPGSLLDRMRNGERGDQLAGAVADAVMTAVHQQVAHGVDVVTDGEQGKTGFFAYIGERLAGFEPRPGALGELWSAEVTAFPEYYAGYFGRAMVGGSVVGPQPLVCVGPVSYRGHAAIARDIANLKVALQRHPGVEAFLPATAPSGLGIMTGSAETANEHYPSYADYLFAVADALAEEYRAIVDGGFLLQVDDPALTDILGDSALDRRDAGERAELFVEATNRALRGLPPDRVRFHTCYGINERARREPGRGDPVDAQGPRGRLVVRGRQRPPRARVPRLAGRAAARRPGAAARGDHACQQHRRAPGADRRADHALRRDRGPGERHRQHGLRLLLPGHLPARGRSRVMRAKFDAMREGARLASERLWP
jgi:methionine synthase II (cobalamin-independent)